MSTTNAVLLTVVVVAIGRWSTGKEFQFNIIVGLVVLALFLAAMGDSHPELASGFATLTLVTALLLYAVPIAKRLNR